LPNPASAALSSGLATSTKENKMAGRKPAIRTLVTVTAPLLATVVLSLSCKQTERYSFWKGTIENYYYRLDMNDQPLQKVVGKPYMVFEYDPLNGYPISVEFGLYDARNEYLPGLEGGSPEPFLAASGLRYASRLGITGSVDLLLNWRDVTSSSKLPSGDFEFEVDKGSNPFGREILHFTYIQDGMMDGEITNATVTWGGRISDLKAFNLYHQFNRGTPY
jgi:hypothetical protein